MSLLACLAEKAEEARREAAAYAAAEKRQAARLKKAEAAKAKAAFDAKIETKRQMVKQKTMGSLAGASTTVATK